MRILEYTITAAEEGWTVEQFLKARLQFTKKQISRLKFRENGLCLNSERCRVSAQVSSGDRLSIGLDEEGKAKREREVYLRAVDSVDADPGNADSGNADSGNADSRDKDSSCSGSSNIFPQILYEDADLLVVYKPGGLAVHPSHGHSRDTLWNQVLTLQMARKESWTPRIIGRLDLATSGIVLFAKTTEAAAGLTRQREAHLLKKTYYAEAEGIFVKKQGTIDRPIEKDPDFLNRMRTGEEGLPAETRYRVLKETEGKSLLEVELKQGRTHQIRVHMAAAGHPLTGDSIYHPEGAKGEAELHLHAGRLEFQTVFEGETVKIESPDPAWLQGWITETKK